MLIDAIGKTNKRIKRFQNEIQEIGALLAEIDEKDLENTIIKIQLEGQILSLQHDISKLVDKKTHYHNALLFLQNLN